MMNGNLRARGDASGTTPPPPAAHTHSFLPSNHYNHPPHAMSGSTPQADKRRRGLFGSLKGKKTATGSEVVLERAATIASIVVFALDLVAEIASNVGIPAVKFGVNSISKVLEKAEQASATKQDVAVLRARITTLQTTSQLLKTSMQGDRLPDPIRERLDRFASAWSQIEAEAETLVSSRLLKRIFDAKNNAEESKRLVTKMSDSVQNFLFESSVSIEMLVHAVYSSVKRIEQATALTKQEETLPLRYAMGALYNQNDARGKCLDNTRVDFLQSLRDWIRNGNDKDIGEDNNNGQDKWILWLSGAAGSGKTTVAYDMAEWCDDYSRRLLLASFFCARSDAECSDVGLIVSTIVHQLCLRSPLFRAHVLEIVGKDKSILQAGFKRQVKELLAQPFEKMSGALRGKVIIIDALDECKDKTAVSTLLDTLLPYLTSSDWPNIIITSRPEQYIRASLESTTTHLILHEVPIPTIEIDITTYLHFNFSKLRRAYGLLEEWPKKEDVYALVKLSGGLFIIASTVVKLLSQSAEPATQLRSLVGLQSQGMIDDLYEQIAKDAAPKAATSNLSIILDTLVVLQRPLSAAALSVLLGLDEIDVRGALADLHSVLLVPKDERPILFFHPTFPEFLIKSSASSTAFHVKTYHSHLFVLQRSLSALGTLQRDIIGIKHPGTELKEVPDVRQKVSATITHELDYACQYWSAHLCILPPEVLAAAAQQLHEFVSIRLLYWLEACALLDIYHDAIDALDASERACQGNKGLVPEIALLLADCRRFALAYIECIRDSPLQIYHFALALVPRSSILMRTYGNLLEHSMVVSEGAEEKWGQCISSFAGHGGKWVGAVAFSPGGASFATGGGDKKVKIWRTLTCGLLLSIDHDDIVEAVAFSPDGTRIISVTKSHLRISDTSTGNYIQGLYGCSGLAYSISYCADGERIVAATSSAVWVWDRPESEARLVHDFHNKNVNIIALSPRHNSFDVAACADDGLHLHRLSSPTPEILPMAGSGCGIAAISPNGYYVAAVRTQGDIVHIWTLTDSRPMRSIHFPNSPCFTCITFSPDSTQIVCGYDGGQIYLEPVTGPHEAPLRFFCRHTMSIGSMSWSPVDSKLVSIGGEDICVWDTTAHSPGETAQASISTSMHRGLPRVAMFLDLDGDSRGYFITIFDLPSPSRFSSCDDVIRLPDDARGTHVLALTLHDDAASAWRHASKLLQLLLHAYSDDPWRACQLASLSGKRTIRSRYGTLYSAVSDDAELLAYIPSASDSTVKVHKLLTGTTVATLADHDASVSSIAFSPDTTHVACGFRDASVSIWSLDTQTKIAYCTTRWPTEEVAHLAFSQNGGLVAAACRSGVEVFEVDTGRCAASLSAPSTFWPADIVFTPDGTHIASLTRYYMFDPFLICRIQQDAEPSTVPQEDTPTFITNFIISNAQSWNLEARLWPRYLGWDGWIYAIGPRGANRVARLPLGFELLPSFGEDLHVLDCPGHRVMSFDMSRVFRYMHSL